MVGLQLFQISEVERKYSAIDNYDGDITEKVKITEQGNKYILC